MIIAQRYKLVFNVQGFSVFILFYYCWDLFSIGNVLTEIHQIICQLLVNQN